MPWAGSSHRSTMRQARLRPTRSLRSSALSPSRVARPPSGGLARKSDVLSLPPTGDARRSAARARCVESAMAKRLRFLGLLAIAAAFCAAATASAAPMRPMLQPGPFHPLAHFTPTDASVQCLNGPPCYVPQEIQAAYNYPFGPGAPTGAGQTIVVVTAYGAPFVANDLLIFDAGLGLPDPPHFRVEKQQLPVSSDGSGFTYIWEVETDLDVQWAHAMAPDANIVVAVANTDDPANVAEVL